MVVGLFCKLVTCYPVPYPHAVFYHNPVVTDCPSETPGPSNRCKLPSMVLVAANDDTAAGVQHYFL